jgi:hypothetical protein
MRDRRRSPEPCVLQALSAPTGGISVKILGASFPTMDKSGMKKVLIESDATEES